MRSASLSTFSLVLLSLVQGCQALSGAADEPVLDRAYFECSVQPVLTESCAQLACHGDDRRPFHLFARNRLRLDGIEQDRNAILDAEELEFDFQAAAAFVDTDAPERSLLLMKPLDQRAGGWFHVGATRYGQGDVFLSRDEPGFVAMEAWARGARLEEPCQ